MDKGVYCDLKVCIRSMMAVVARSFQNALYLILRREAIPFALKRNGIVTMVIDNLGLAVRCWFL